jgi:hypothetical protein
MNERDSGAGAGDNAISLEACALLDRVAAAMAEIEQAKSERSTGEIRAARTHLAALHGVARLRREAERGTNAA